MNNEKGKNLLEKTKLQYTKDIINQIKENPELMEPLLQDLDVSIEELIEKLNNKNTNITFYDQAILTLEKEMNR